jgi:HK97 family phage major capsid protein
MKTKLKIAMDAQAAIVTAAEAAGKFSAEDKAKFDALDVDIKGIEDLIQAQAAVDARAAANNTAVNKPDVRIEITNDKAWGSMGEYLMAVKAAGTPGGSVNPKLLNTKGAATGMNEQINSDGGFLVGEEFVAELLKKAHDASPIVGLCRKIPIGAGKNRIRMNGVDESSRANGSRWGGVQAYWASEAATVAASKPKFKKVEMDLDKLMAFCYLTDELMEDQTALAAVVSEAFGEEMAFKLDDAVLTGTGVGVPLGVMKSSALISVAKEAGQAADTIVHNNILKMFNRLWNRSRANAVWLINQDIEPQLETMSIAIGTAGEMSPYAKEYVERGTIKGRPVIPVEQCETLGDKGDIVLADMSQYLLIDKGGVKADSSMHVRFLYDEQCMRFTYRVNGMPLWDSPLTPFKGSSTLSPFITLDAR